MWIYEVNNQEDCTTDRAYFSTLSDARRCARNTASDGRECTVRKSELCKMSRQMAANLLNHRGWCTGKHVDIEKWQPGKMTVEHKGVYERDEYRPTRVILQQTKEKP